MDLLFVDVLQFTAALKKFRFGFGRLHFKSVVVAWLGRG